MIRSLIIDDEAHNRDTLAKMLARFCPDIRVAGTASGVRDGIGAIRQLQPDLVFLDLHLSDGSGFDLLHALQPIGFRIIFVSAMDKETVQAFRLSSIEYLLKPVSPPELAGAVRRVMQTDIKDFNLQLKALEENVK